MDFLQIERSDVEWIGLAPDRYRWRPLVNAVMKLRFHKMLGDYRVAAQLCVASGVVFSSTELYIYICVCVCMKLKKCSNVGLH
jgi:hypothetical protein